MSIADIVIIIIVALMALLGLWKGFFKTLISFCGWFVSILVAVFTAGVVAEALLDIEAVGQFVAGSGESGFSLYAFFMGVLPEELMSLVQGASEGAIEGAMGGGAAGAILKPFIALLTGDAIAGSAATVGEGIALLLAGGMFEVMVGIGMFIIARIVMTLLVLFLKSLLSGSKQGALSRLGGFLFGAVRGALYCAILLVIVGFLTPFNFMEPVTAEIDKGVLAKPLAEQVYALSGKLTSNENYFNKLLKIRGVQGPSDDQGEPGDQLGAAAENVNDFLANALKENGGYFDVKLTGEERPRYNQAVESIRYKLSDASTLIKNGIEGKDDEMETLAGYMSAGSGTEQAGDLYRAFKVLAYDLNDYHNCTDESLLEDMEAGIDTDLANIVYLFKNTPFEELFGEFSITGLSAEHDLERLELADRGEVPLAEVTE